MTTVLSHVYSGSNLGDGLLTRLSIEILDEAGYSPDVTVAIDPVGSPVGSEVVTHGRRPRSKTGSALEVFASMGVGSAPAVDALRRAQNVVAVGGGYLRSRTPRESAVLRVTHLAQLRAEAHARRRLYLPQSIGPLPRSMRRVVLGRLASADAVMVRDDVSLNFLNGMSNLHRIPDLAALKVAESNPELGTNRENVVVVQLRQVSGHRNLGSIVTESLKSCGLEVVHAIQSDSGRSNDDRVLVSDLGLSGVQSLSVVLDTQREAISVAVCGRLHGAISCILAGVPTLHIPYERKSYGVFHDLGLSEYLVEAKEIYAGRLPDRVLQLSRNREVYWTSLQNRRDKLLKGRAQLLDLLCESLADGPVS